MEVDTGGKWFLFLVFFGRGNLHQDWWFFLENFYLNEFRRNWIFDINNIIQPKHSTKCSLCKLEGETSIHFFLFCVVDGGVWNLVMTWIYFCFITPLALFMHLECWSREASNEKLGKGYWFLWQVTIWVIWRVQNMNFFNNVVKKVEELVDEVKVLSWRWFLARLKVSICFYYERCWNPNDCILRWVLLESSKGSSILYRYGWLLGFITSVNFLHGVVFFGFFCSVSVLLVH